MNIAEEFESLGDEELEEWRLDVIKDRRQAIHNIADLKGEIADEEQRLSETTVDLEAIRSESRRRKRLRMSAIEYRRYRPITPTDDPEADEIGIVVLVSQTGALFENYMLCSFSAEDWTLFQTVTSALYREKGWYAFEPKK